MYKVKQAIINPINVIAGIALIVGSYVIIQGAQVADSLMSGFDFTTVSKQAFLNTYRNYTGWDLKDDLEVEGTEIVGQVGTASTGTAITSSTGTQTNGKLPPPPAVGAGDNFDIAYAMILMNRNVNVWNGTNSPKGHSPKYKQVWDLAINSGNLWDSCDRSAATAIRWCGADVNFPFGGTEKQYEYLTNSSLWTEVDWRKPEPGDIMISTPQGRSKPPGKGHVSHIAVYVGNNNILKYIPDTVVKDGNTISGSIDYIGNTFTNGTGPHVKPEYTYYKPGLSMGDWTFFRRNSKDRNKKYWTGLPAGENWTDLWSNRK